MRLLVAALAVLLCAPAASAAPPYLEPQAGTWAYDQYMNTSFKAGSFRVKAGTASRPPRVARFRLGLDSAAGRCPAIGTMVAVVGKVPLQAAPERAAPGARNVWLVAGEEVQVRVGSKAPVPGTLSLSLLQSHEGGTWRWVIGETVLRVGHCRLTPLSGRPRP